MTKWLRRLRGALGMGVVWAGGGAFVGGLIELVSNLFPALPLYFIDMWIPTLAIPGFFGGVIFSAVLGVAAGRRRLDELSMSRVVAWGTLGGVLLGTLFVALGAGPLVFVPAILLSGLGASLTLAFARMAEGQDLLGGASEAGDVGLTPEEERELLGMTDRTGKDP